jgi:hypothetical protein
MNPIACDLTAIPPDRREEHRALVRSLLFDGGAAPVDVPDGITVRLPADRFGDAVRFIENERRCCPHLAFKLEVLPRATSVILTIVGPGAREELETFVG